MKTLLSFAVAGILISNAAHADVIKGDGEPYAICRGYDGETFTLFNTAVTSYKDGLLNFAGENIHFQCTETERDPSVPIFPDQPVQLWKCVERDEGALSVSIQTLGIIPNVVGYVYDNEGIVTAVGCPTL